MIEPQNTARPNCDHCRWDPVSPCTYRPILRKYAQRGGSNHRTPPRGRIEETGFSESMTLCRVYLLSPATGFLSVGITFFVIPVTRVSLTDFATHLPRSSSLHTLRRVFFPRRRYFREIPLHTIGTMFDGSFGLQTGNESRLYIDSMFGSRDNFHSRRIEMFSIWSSRYYWGLWWLKVCKVLENI